MSMVYCGSSLGALSPNPPKPLATPRPPGGTACSWLYQSWPLNGNPCRKRIVRPDPVSSHASSRPLIVAFIASPWPPDRRSEAQRGADDRIDPLRRPRRVECELHLCALHALHGLDRGLRLIQDLRRHGAEG